MASFITVTTTITGSAVPTVTYNATQLHQLQVSKDTGQIVALSVLGLFVLLGVVMLLCLGILRLQRPPPPPPQTQNPDSVKHGGGSFLPIIGRQRKSRANLPVDPSTQSLMGDGGATMGESNKSRRISMWAEGGQVPPIPSPPLQATHSRASSTHSAAGHGQTAGQSRASSTSSTSPTHRINYGYVNHANSSLEYIPLNDGFTQTAAITHGHVDQTPTMAYTPEPEGGRYSSEEGREVSPIVSPESSFRGRVYDNRLPRAPRAAFAE